MNLQDGQIANSMQKGNNKLMTNLGVNTTAQFYQTDTTTKNTNDILIANQTNKTFGNANNQQSSNAPEKHDFFFTVHSFMTRDLGLRGSSLIVYAIIYAFSADGKGTYFGNMDFLAERGGLGNSTVRSSIQSLLRDNFIYIVQGEKHESKHYGVTQSKLKLITSSNSGCRNQAPEALKSSSLEAENGLGCQNQAPQVLKSSSLEAKIGLGCQNQAPEVLKSSSRGAEIEQVGAEIEQVGCQNRAPGVLKSSTNNKYYNKYNNNSIYNNYNTDSADAQIRESIRKKEENFKKYNQKVVFTKAEREYYYDHLPFDNSDQVAIHQYLASFIPAGTVLDD